MATTIQFNVDNQPDDNFDWIIISNKIDTTKFLLFVVENYKNLQTYDFNSNFFKQYN